jgi:hypothetical protein
MTNERFDKVNNPLPTLKDVILDVAGQRNDEVARRVSLHIGFLSDLPSAECKYHVRCYNSFMKIPLYADLPTGTVDDKELQQVIECMNQNKSKVWNSIQLHELYTNLGGELTRREMFKKLTDCISKDFVIVRVDGCATLVGFREIIAKHLKVVKVAETDESSINSVVRQIKREARSIKYNSAHYDLSEFTQANTVKSTSPTLLKLISDLISEGEVTKQFLSLSQSIQSHITNTRNQTTLGLAVKLQHHYGSSELRLEINVDESVAIGCRMAPMFRTSLPTGFHATISSPIKTMEHMKKGVKVGEKTIFDLETIFLRLLTIGQQRQIDLAPIFMYELCPVPSSLLDEYGFLRKGSKAPLAQKLCVKISHPPPPAVTIIDVSQLLYHITWPCKGDASAIVKPIKTRLSFLPGKKVLVFDKYNDVSAKDHERVRRAGIGSINYELTVNTPLPRREAIMRNKHNKRQLAKVLSTFNFGKDVTIDSHSDGIFGHDEADITMISYLLQACDSDVQIIRILSDDTDVFVLLVYWVYRHNIQARVQMERWDGAVWDINATCAQLGHKCLQILGLHYLTGSDATSYLYGRGKVSALKTLQAGDFSARSMLLRNN